ncbi:MAG: hypothetical protein H7842_14985, partial [Gammaproteobacteria bacterium SHHR-1]
MANQVKILLVGALSIDYVYWHWLYPLRDRFNVTCLDISPLLNAKGTDFTESYLLRILQESKPDLFFFYSDAIQAFFTDIFFKKVRAGGVRIVSFHADDDPDV